MGRAHIIVGTMANLLSTTSSSSSSSSDVLVVVLEMLNCHLFYPFIHPLLPLVGRRWGEDARSPTPSLISRTHYIISSPTLEQFGVSLFCCFFLALIFQNNIKNDTGGGHSAFWGHNCMFIYSQLMITIVVVPLFCEKGWKWRHHHLTSHHHPTPCTTIATLELFK
jgi:hypothetical protein